MGCRLSSVLKNYRPMCEAANGAHTHTVVKQYTYTAHTSTRDICQVICLRKSHRANSSSETLAVHGGMRGLINAMHSMSVVPATQAPSVERVWAEYTNVSVPVSCRSAGNEIQDTVADARLRPLSRRQIVEMFCYD